MLSSFYELDGLFLCDHEWELLEKKIKKNMQMLWEVVKSELVKPNSSNYELIEWTNSSNYALIEHANSSNYELVKWKNLFDEFKDGGWLGQVSLG